MFNKPIRKQDVRRSQFITTYGPGALIEGPNGPAVILMPEVGLFKHLDLRPSDFQIKNSSLQKIVGGNIFRVPSNQELGLDNPIYRTKSFPEWHLCVENEIHSALSVLFNGSRCPICRKETDHQQAVRFIMACPKGHLDDVQWEMAVHNGKKCEKNVGREPFFLWYQKGPTLWNISIVCQSCKSQRIMGDIFYNWHECSSRFPERESANDIPKRPHSCNFGPSDTRTPSVLHRGALNLHLPTIYSAISIQPTVDKLHEFLNDDKIYTTINTLNSIGSLTKENLRRALEKIDISESDKEDLLSYDISRIASTLIAASTQKGAETYSEMLEQEFIALKTGAVSGSSEADFEISPTSIQVFSSTGSTKVKFRIAPISRLKVVMIQHSYARVDPIEGQRIEICYEEQLPLGRTRKWFPGVELSGEGIFITIDPPSFAPIGQASKEWEIINNKCGKGTPFYKDNLFRDPESKRIELNPLFIWWHSLSHKFLTWLAIDSGYSSASMRERVYCNGDEGGILLYTSQPGGDGSLGGLIGLTDRLQRILKDAYLSADSCSNDPFCDEIEVAKGGYAGAACYACLFLPETSCEHRNMWLDRRILHENSLW